MKAVIFAGGIGTRMWPASRTKQPKQFHPLVGDKSTLELTYYKFVGSYVPEDKIYVSTNEQYVPLVKEKVTNLKDSHIFPEPAMRDVGPSVGYALSILNKFDPLEPVLIAWADDLVKKTKTFKKLLGHAEEYLKENPDQLVYIGQKPLFPDQNKGWIHFGKAIKHFNGISMYKFQDFHYRPPSALTKKFFEDGEHAVNSCYFASTPKFIMDQYKKFAPQMYKILQKLADTWGTKEYLKVLKMEYPKLEKISFDDLIATKISDDQAVTLMADFGWYGFGDWDSIKEALQESPSDIVTLGDVANRNSKDSLVYNFTDKMIATVGLEGMLVVATDDVVMVAPKEAVPEIKKMLKDFKGTKNEKYT